MFKKVLMMSVLATLAGTSAMAVTINGATVSKDGKVVSVAHGSTNYTAPSHAPKGAATIFSNVGTAYPKGLYFCCYGNTISGAQSELGSQNWVAMQFTPSKNATVSEVDAAVGYFAGTNQITLGLYSDKNGAPGKKITDSDVNGLQAGGGCCGLAVLKVKKVQVKAGTPYWVTVTTENANDTFAFWNFNSTDQIDPVQVAVNTGSGWQGVGGGVPAPSFAVYGK